MAGYKRTVIAHQRYHVNRFEVQHPEPGCLAHQPPALV